jgi:hypothetical protein
MGRRYSIRFLGLQSVAGPDSIRPDSKQLGDEFVPTRREFDVVRRRSAGWQGPLTARG